MVHPNFLAEPFGITKGPSAMVPDVVFYHCQPMAGKIRPTQSLLGSYLKLG